MNSASGMKNLLKQVRGGDVDSLRPNECGGWMDCRMNSGRVLGGETLERFFIKIFNYYKENSVMCDPYASYVVESVDVSGRMGKVFITNDKDGIYLSAAFNRLFLSKFTEYSLNVGMGLYLAISQDIVTPTMVYDEDKSPATTVLLCSTVNEQKVKLETKELIHFMFVKEFVGDLSLLFFEADSSII